MLQYSPRIVTDSLVMCLDPSQNKSYPAADLPVKDGLNLWLDAADDTTFSYSSGTTVSQWRDKSGLNNHVAQSIVANQPSRNSTKNSRKTVVFDGSNDNLFNSGNVFPSNTTDYTKIAVVYQTSTATTGNIISSKTGTAGGNYAHAFYFSGTNFIRLWHDTDFVISNTALNTNTLGIVSGTYVNSSGSGALYVNGAAAGTGTAANRNIVRDIQIGGIVDCCFFTGEICEVLVFSRVLSATELKQVHTYLGQKWGISNTDRQIFDLSGNNFNFLFNGTNPRYNAKTIVSNFNTTSPYAVSSFGGQNLTSSILNLLYVDHTIEVAVNLKGFKSVKSFDNPRIYEGGAGIVLWQGYHAGLYVDSDTEKLTYLIWNSDPTNVYIEYALPNDLKDKILYITAKRQANVLSIFINGVLVAGPTSITTTVRSYSQINIGAAFQGDPSSGGSLGAFVWAGQHEYHLLRMYNKALSSSEIVSNYQAFKARLDNNIIRYGLVLDLDASNPYSYGGAGTTVYDTSNTALSWTASNTTYNTDPIKYFSFNGSNSSLVSSTSTAYDSQTITMECWCYPNTLTQNGFLFEKGQVNTQYSMFFSTTNIFYFRTIGGTINNQDLTFTTTTYLTVSSWNHIVCTYNGSAKTIYVNGAQVATVAASGALQTGQTNQYIGKYGALGDNYPFNGRIAESRVYNIALSAAQVLQNYNATKGRFGL